VPGAVADVEVVGGWGRGRSRGKGRGRGSSLPRGDGQGSDGGAAHCVCAPAAQTVGSCRRRRRRGCDWGWAGSHTPSIPPPPPSLRSPAPRAAQPPAATLRAASGAFADRHALPLAPGGVVRASPPGTRVRLFPLHFAGNRRLDAFLVVKQHAGVRTWPLGPSKGVCGRSVGRGRRGRLAGRQVSGPRGSPGSRCVPAAQRSTVKPPSPAKQGFAGTVGFAGV
jgi:hypothetical protein